MKRYSTVHPLYMSFYSKPLYRDVAQNWGKLSFLYLFLLLSVCIIPSMFKFHSEVSEYLDRKAPKIIKQFPVITISKGQVSVDAEMPYVIKDPETGSVLIILDTTGKVTSLEDSNSVVLLTKTQLILKKPPKDKIFDLSGINHLTITQSGLYDWMETFLDYFIYAVYPAGLLFSLLFRTVEALVFAALGTFFASSVKVSLRYPAIVSLAMVSMTPSIILDTLYNSADADIPFWWFINFSIALGYLFFAIRACAQQETAQT